MQPVKQGGFIVVVGFVAILLSGMETRLEAAEEAPDQTETSAAEVVVETEEVVVSATKTPVPVKRVTSSVEVIKGEDLQERKVKTVTDALRLGQGMAVFSTGGPGTQSSVRIRGGTAAQTLVFLDGAVMNSGTTGAYNFANLTTDNLEQIEILRGSQSMLWGSDAMGGVINIRTKRGRGTPSATAFFEYGSFLSIREGATFSGEHGPFDFSFALSRWDFTGFSTINYKRGAIERDAYRNWQGSTRLGADLPWKGRLEFNFRWINGDTDFDAAQDPGFDVFKRKSTSEQFVYSGSYWQQLTDWWDQLLTLSRQTEDLKIQNGTLRRNVVTGEENPVFLPMGVQTDEIDTAANRIEWQHNFQVGNPLLLTAGYQFREQLGEGEGNSPFTERIISSNSLFGEAQVNLFDRVFATGGVRQDEFNVFESATTWRVTGAYLHQSSATKVRGSYGTGFRAPSLNELFFPGFGNPDLQPEKSQSLDAGIDQFLFNERVTMSAVYFWNRYRDLIQNVQSLQLCGEDPFFPGEPGFCPVNIGQARAQGWEISFNSLLLANHRFARSLALRGQYTYTNTENLDTGNDLPRWPEHQASAVLNYQPIDPLRIDLEFRFVGERFNDVANQEPMESFTVFNLFASYDINEHLEVYTRVDNLFDENYEEVRLFGTPIRSIYGGIRTNFQLPLGSS